MAISSALKGPWNPFRITDTDMAPGLLLLCKLLAVALLATGHFRILPVPFLPFLPILDRADPQIFQTGLQAGVILFSILLLFNRWARVTAFLLGSCLLLAVVSSKAYYGNNKTFVGLMLVLSALSSKEGPAYLVRWQFSLVYFGAALNKLLDPDWQSGLFFDYWGAVKVQNPVFREVRDWLPPLVAGQILCWVTILAEFFIAFALFIPRLIPWALWANALFQIGLLQFTGGTFTLFFYAMNAAALAFLSWPKSVLLLSEKIPGWGRSMLQALDSDGMQKWKTPGELSLRSCPAFLIVEEEGRQFGGISALIRLLILSPVFWMSATAVLALLPGDANEARRLLAGLVFFFLLPGFIQRHPKEEINPPQEPEVHGSF